MNPVKKAVWLFSAISIYKGMLNRSVVSAFVRLLKKNEAPPQEFLSAWAQFFHVLSEKGHTESFSQSFIEAALFDENCFSTAMAKNEAVPAAVENAVVKEMQTILSLSKITPETVLECYKEKDAIAEVSAVLPRWRLGAVTGLLEQRTDVIENLAGFYQKNGCGIYARYRAFLWRNGTIEPVLNPDQISLSQLKEYEYPRGLVVENTLAFIKGKSSNNCLLYGDKGTGKSSTVKAVLNAYADKKLRIIEMPKEQLKDFPLLVDKIATVPMKFIIFIDDLSFLQQDDSYTALKAVLEGGIAAKPENTLIYATSNRRHLVRESFAERSGDDVHRNDTMQESLSLADRFGLTVNFLVPSKDSYLEIVKAIAHRNKININDDELFVRAEQWALERGGRSPRRARQFIDSLASKE